MIITCGDATLMNSLWLLSLTAMWCRRMSCQEGAAGYEKLPHFSLLKQIIHDFAGHLFSLSKWHAQDWAAQQKITCYESPCQSHRVRAPENNCERRKGTNPWAARPCCAVNPCGSSAPEMLSPSLLSSKHLLQVPMPTLWGRCIHPTFPHFPGSWAACWGWPTLHFLQSKGITQDFTPPPQNSSFPIKILSFAKLGFCSRHANNSCSGTISHKPKQTKINYDSFPKSAADFNWPWASNFVFQGPCWKMEIMVFSENSLAKHSFLQ